MAHQGPRPKYMELFPKDLWGDGDVQALEGGVLPCAYVALLTWAWNSGALLADPERALRRIGFDREAAAEVWSGLRHLWVDTGAGWTQERLWMDYQEAAEKRKKAVARSAKANAVRWKEPPKESLSAPQGVLQGVLQGVHLGGDKESPPRASPAPAPAPAPAPVKRQTSRPPGSRGKPAASPPKQPVKRASVKAKRVADAIDLLLEFPAYAGYERASKFWAALVRQQAKKRGAIELDVARSWLDKAPPLPADAADAWEEAWSTNRTAPEYLYSKSKGRPDGRRPKPRGGEM